MLTGLRHRNTPLIKIYRVRLQSMLRVTGSHRQQSDVPNELAWGHSGSVLQHVCKCALMPVYMQHREKGREITFRRDKVSESERMVWVSEGCLWCRTLIRRASTGQRQQVHCPPGSILAAPVIKFLMPSCTIGSVISKGQRGSCVIQYSHSAVLTTYLITPG